MTWLLGLFMLAAAPTFGQLQPVKWELSTVEEEPGIQTLVFKADIDPGWKIYSQDYDTTAITKPIPLALYLEQSDAFELVGKTKELGRAKVDREPLFENIVVVSYEKKVVLRQQLRLGSPETEIVGYFDYMTCDAGKCIPFQGNYFRYANAKLELIPETDELLDKNYVQTAYEPVEGKPAPQPTASEPDVIMEPQQKKRSLWGYFVLGLGGGLFALLTPCVFPMIPLTVSFFTKRSTSKRKGLFNALLYASSIVFIFIALGFVITSAFGPEMLNVMATNKWFNLAFFSIFIVFALSFFGAFDINLPSKWVTGADRVADRGGLVGVFFMAFTLVLVSFSCTMPIIGTVIILIADSGEFWAPLVGMLGFSLALAIPFALFAAGSPLMRTQVMWAFPGSFSRPFRSHLRFTWFRECGVRP
jgi:thiol:disulfide interchange protein DsbD